MDNYFNVNQAAFILKVHPLTIRRYIREGKLKAVKIGGGVRIKEKDLNDFSKDFTPTPSTPNQPAVFREKLVTKTFSVNDPLFRLQARGARIKLST